MHMHSWSVHDSSYPDRLRQRLRNRAPKRIGGIGNAELLQGKLVGILSSRTLAAGILLKAKYVLQEFLALGPNVRFAGGWQSPMERECLELLLTRRANVVYCLPYHIQGFKPSGPLADALEAERLLVLSRDSQKRPSRASNERRNRLVWALSDALLVLHAPGRSGTSRMASEAVSAGVPVFLPEHADHEFLFSDGARPAAIDAIIKTLGGG